MFWKQIAPQSLIHTSWLRLYRRKFFTFVVVFPLMLMTTTFVVYYNTTNHKTSIRHTYLNIGDYNFIQPNEFICKQTNPNSPLLLIIIHSARSHFTYRKGIRDTYGSVASHKKWTIRTVFVLGSSNLADVVHDSSSSTATYNQTLLQKEVEEESNTYGDMIISDFYDSYRNLTIKHLVGYKWILSHCSTASYVVKSDDDMYINVYKLINYLKKKSTRNHTQQIACHKWEDSPKRYGSDKWKVTQDEYDDDKYPSFCMGAAYITTPNLIKNLYQQHTQVPYFWIDDIYVTGLLRAYFNRHTTRTSSSSPKKSISSNLNKTSTTKLHVNISIDNIEDLYQLKENTWESEKIFYLLKRESDNMQFNVMDFFWNLTLAQKQGQLHISEPHPYYGRATKVAYSNMYYIFVSIAIIILVSKT